MATVVEGQLYWARFAALKRGISQADKYTAGLLKDPHFAFFCHQDSVFTEKNFKDYKDIGRGGNEIPQP